MEFTLIPLCQLPGPNYDISQRVILAHTQNGLTTGVEVFIGSKVQCLLCIVEQVGEKGVTANFKTKNTEPLIQEIPRPLYKSS